MAQQRRLVVKGEPANVAGPRFHRDQAVGHIVHVIPGVDPAWNGEAQQLKIRSLLLAASLVGMWEFYQMCSPGKTMVLRKLRTRLPDSIPLIGVGGILSGADAVAKMSAGASLVQCYSGLVYRGPDLVRDCVEAIRRRRDFPSGGPVALA